MALQFSQNTQSDRKLIVRLLEEACTVYEKAPDKDPLLQAR